jgi:disulfide bond formation protein DsbB
MNLNITNLSAFICRRIILLAGLASAFALGTALIAQYGFDLEPCVLCVYQRIPYVAVIGIGLVTFLLPGADRRAVIYLIALVFLCSAGVAFYHNGVEQHWWVAATSCAAGGGGILSTTIEQLQSMLTGKLPKPCDAIDWTLFGLSITVYNTVASLALALVCFLCAGQSQEEQT